MESHGFNANSINPINHLRCLLANVIVHCMGKELDKAVIKNCSKRAMGRPLGLYGVWSPSSNAKWGRYLWPFGPSTTLRCWGYEHGDYWKHVNHNHAM